MKKDQGYDAAAAVAALSCLCSPAAAECSEAASSSSGSFRSNLGCRWCTYYLSTYYYTVNSTASSASTFPEPIVSILLSIAVYYVLSST